MTIITTPNPILIHPSAPVAKIDKKILELIEKMKQTLLNAEKPKGVGLAAPQIGQNLRIFLTKPSPKSPIQVFLNPQIIWQSKDLIDDASKKNSRLEGCLSIPGVWGVVKRHLTIKLRYQSPDGKQQTQKFTGFMATIIQHEVDHLDGRLFSSRVLEQKGKFYQTKKDEENKEVLEELKLT